MFQSVTTIGFGDVIAGLDWNDCDAKDVTQNLHHQNNFYWVISLSLNGIEMRVIIMTFAIKLRNTKSKFHYFSLPKLVSCWSH